MLKAAVFSDTHGNTAPMLEAARGSGADVFIHLGDHDRDAVELRRAFPEVPLYSVCGNCDLNPLAPERLLVQLGPVKAFLTHGHLYGVSRAQADWLVYAAQEQGAQIAMFGHTHRAMQTQRGGVLVMNPGTAGKGGRLTWALVEVLSNGGVAVSINDMEP